MTAAESFATKFFTESISVQGIREGGIDPHLFRQAFAEFSSRELTTADDDGRGEKSLNLVFSLVNTPRRFHRFKYALGRRLPALLDEVDDFDVMLVAALEACDSRALRIIIEAGTSIFENGKTAENDIKSKFEQLDDTEKSACQLLLAKETNDSIDKYTRAAAKEHWRAAFLGLGRFQTVKNWISLLGKQSRVETISALQELLCEVDRTSGNHEIVTDTLRHLFQKRYTVQNDSEVITLILQEVGQSKIGPLVVPTLARLIQKQLSAIEVRARVVLLKTFLQLQNVDYALPGRLFFYLVENQEQGHVVSKLSDDQAKELSQILLHEFSKKRDTLDFSENCTSYLFRVKWAAQYLQVEDPTIAAVVSSLENPSVLNKFVMYLLSLRHPWQPKLSDHHIDMLDKLIGIQSVNDLFLRTDTAELNDLTRSVIKDFTEKFAATTGDVQALSARFD